MQRLAWFYSGWAMPQFVVKWGYASPRMWASLFVTLVPLNALLALAARRQRPTRRVSRTLWLTTILTSAILSEVVCSLMARLFRPDQSLSTIASNAMFFVVFDIGLFVLIGVVHIVFEMRGSQL